MNEHEHRRKKSRAVDMRRMKEPLKDIELRLISELMKHSRRSDRELAKVMRVSQSTVTRARKRLEKTGVIREYTIIPDFCALGYNIMGATRFELRGEPAHEKTKETRQKVIDAEDSPRINLIAAEGMGREHNSLFVNFYESYSDYDEAINLLRQARVVNFNQIDTFLVDLNNKRSYRILSMSAVAKHLQRRLAKKLHNS
jgi:DNA-binding Lrp family transcriptional regulator